MTIVYTKNNCPQCEMTKRVLTELGVKFDTINVEENEEALRYVKDTLGFSAMPVIVAEGRTPFTGFQPDKLNELKGE